MKKALTDLCRALVALICFATVAPIQAQSSDSLFTRTEAMILMRDGVRLHTRVFTPSGAAEKLPILLLRTPYGIGDLSSAQLAAALPELTADGYVIVQQDIRGRFKSEGQFVMLRQPRDPKNKKAIDESTDTYDTIEWLLKHTPNNNGRVGMAGTSYGAWLTVMGMLDPHPSLKAVVPQASPADMWMGDDFHHNGAFRLSYGLEYAYMMESSKEIADVSTLIDRYDAYEWYLDEKPEPLPANAAVYYQIAFPANDHVFKKGHRIMVQVQSSWFPVIDRNPQRFVPNIFQAKESDFQLATQRVYHSGRYASYIAVPVVEPTRP